MDDAQTQQPAASIAPRHLVTPCITSFSHGAESVSHNIYVIHGWWILRPILPHIHSSYGSTGVARRIYSASVNVPARCADYMLS